MLDRLDQSFEQQRRFTADASHEFRTPLAMLVSRAGLALERRRSPAEYERVLGEIRDEGLRMGRIVNDLLMLARADAGDVVAVTERLDAGELVGSVVEAMSPLALERGVQLRHDADADLGVIGDQTRIMQLVVNLVDNALAHTSSGGRVLLSAFRDSDTAVLEVVDSGSGIPPEHLPHVFERFHRARNVDDRRFAGMGLGLFIARGIVEQHGGRIWVESRPGDGSTFCVALPRARVEDHQEMEMMPLIEDTVASA